VHTVGVQLIVNPATPADFTISAPDITIKRGKTGNDTITVTPSNGFTGSVAIGLTGVPAGFKATLNPGTVNGGGGTSTLQISVPNNAKQGTYPISITGTSGSLVHSINMTLTVN
jgi:uncharacterized membrane protein